MSVERIYNVKLPQGTMVYRENSYCLVTPRNQCLQRILRLVTSGYHGI